ncbi:MAG TPA: hypothetical protein PKW80_11125 [Bacteroidales bacterium]|nr:hypothetical protein [Bacteroidales bacterium]
MNKALTLEEILLYTYGDPCETPDADIENMLETEKLLNEEFQHLNQTRQIIDESMVDPPDSIVSKIVAYSNALTILNISEPDLRCILKN